MKIVKPLTLGLLQRCYTQGGVHRMVVTVLGFFTLGQPVPARLLREADQWARVIPAMPPGQPLDEAMPKACGEILVFGQGFGRDGQRVRIGTIDKRVAPQAMDGPYPLPQFAPIPISAPERKRHAGTYDDKWLREEWPGLPRDLDWRLYNQAPEDQRVQAWLGAGMAYRIDGMNASQPVIEGALPAHRVRAFAKHSSVDEVPLVLDTVWFAPGIELGVMAWRGQMVVADSDGLDVTALMLAYEDGASAARPLADYEKILKLRLDTATGALHAFNESQLAPPDGANGAAPALLQLHPDLPPVQAPNDAQIAAGDMDLAPMMAQIEAVKAKVEADAHAQLARLPEAVAASPPPPSLADVLRRAAAADPPFADLRWLSPTPATPAQALGPDIAAALGKQILEWIAAGVSISGRDLAGADLRGACLAGVDLSGCLLEYADLSNADLRGAKLAKATLSHATFSHADLGDADLSEANLCGSFADAPILARARLCNARAADARWPGAQAQGADLSIALLERTDLSGACFDDALLRGTVFNETVMRGGFWRGAKAERCVAWRAQAQGCDFSRSQWQRGVFPESDLSASIWREARLEQLQGTGADWSRADMRGVRAERCAWSGAPMRGSRLDGAFLSHCDLSRADLSEAVLDEGCFAGSIFMQARFIGASARKADFFRALLRKADFTDADLRESSLYQAQTTGIVMPLREAA